MRPLLRVTALLAAAVLGCGEGIPNATAPPAPAGLAPWPDLAWEDGTFEAGDPTTGQEVMGVAAGPGVVVTVAMDTDGPPADGVIRWSSDARSWTRADTKGLLEGVDLVDVAATPDGFVALGTASGDPFEGRPPRVLVLTSGDGRRWEAAPALPGLASGYAGSVTAGPAGVVVLATNEGGGPSAWTIGDGDTWAPLEDSEAGPAAALIADPHRGGWIGLGPNVGRPVALHLAEDGAWSVSPIDDADDRRAYRIAAGPGGYLVLGGQGDCGSPFASCAEASIGWWSGDGVDWVRLPADSPVGAGGVTLATDPRYGYLAVRGDGAWGSPEGWTWTPMPGGPPTQVDDLVVIEHAVVAVGTRYRPDGSNQAWIGVAPLE